MNVVPIQSARYSVLEDIATTREQVKPFNCSIKIQRINNDGAYAIQFKLDNGDWFTMLPGESEEHLHTPCNYVHYLAIGGSSSFRMIGV